MAKLAADGRKYRAFISYSHSDRKWGDWLHNALETYRVPPRIAKKAARGDKIPNRLFPIFRDREELPTSADLGDSITDALERSRYLIVICSPRSAGSRWVNEEVKAFKALGREDRILCLIVDGEPNASDQPASKELECFAPALRLRVGRHGRLSRKRVEPIAADARRGKDGRDNALLKIIAGLLGVGYDELKQREKQRRARLLEEKRKAKARRSLELGRQELVSGHYLAAARHLRDAHSNDKTDSDIRGLLSQALEAVERPCVKLIGHSGEISAIDFSPDESRVVTASRDKTARVWNATTGELLLTVDHAHAPVRSAQFSPDGSNVVTGTDFDECGLRIWDAVSGSLLRQPERFCVSPVERFVFDASSRAFLTFTTHDRNDCIHDLDSGGLVARIAWAGDEASGEACGVSFAAFAPGLDRKLLIGCTDGYARLVDARTGEILKAYGPHQRTVVRAFLRGQTVLTITWPFEWWSWDDSSGGESHRHASDRLKFIPETLDVSDGLKCAALSGDGTLKIWDLFFTGKLAASLRPHNGKASSARFTPDGACVVTSTRGDDDPQEASAKLWDAKSGRLLAAIGGHIGGTYRTSISRDGRRVALASDNVVTVWTIAEIAGGSD